MARVCLWSLNISIQPQNYDGLNSERRRCKSDWEKEEDDEEEGDARVIWKTFEKSKFVKTTQDKEL